MADVKISNLPASTTPLAGTEVLPIVQSGTTKKVSVDNLTTGKSVTALDLTLTGLTASKSVFTDANQKLTTTGTVATNQGGTGLTSFTSNGVVYASSTSALTTSSNLVFNGSQLGINMSPSFTLDMTGSDIRLWNQTAAGTVRMRLRAYDNSTASFLSFDTGGVIRQQITKPTYATSLEFRSPSNNTAGYDFYVNSGAAESKCFTITSGQAVLVVGSAGLGYGAGSGGAVTQDTSRTNGVTLNKTNGAITLVSAAGTATWQTFTVTNSTVAATDTVIVNQKSGTDLYQIFVTNVAAGSFKITFATTGGTTTEQPVFNFAVIKAVTS